MSYKSLLFCPDEKTARTVTQVLSELDFTVETVAGPYLAVKKLSDERYDALVVDCQNEQDATLLFKTARNSAQNHSSLSVAVVEGQTGVAKAFRIGANLVLTKPINIEQSKSTLRVARGLLRKNEQAKPGRPAEGAEELSQPVTVTSPPPIMAVTPPSPALPRTPRPAVSGLTTQTAAPPPAPFSRIEVEPEPAPATEAAELAVLDSLPELSGRTKRPTPAPVATAKPEPIAISSSGLGAAAAPAREKPIIIQPKTPGVLPILTNDPMVKETSHEVAGAAPIPEFAGLNVHVEKQGGGAKKFLKTAIQLALIAGVGYLAWEKLHLLEYLHRSQAAEATGRPSSTPAPVIAPAAASEAAPAPSQASAPADISPASAPEPKMTISPTHANPSHDEMPATVAVQELPMSGEVKSTAPPKPAPLMVKPGSATPAEQNASVPALAPPPLEVAAADNSKSTLDNLVSGANASVPRIAPGSVVVSQGVSQGLLMKKVPPTYSSLALQLHKEGPVQLVATINKQGSITNVKLLSGDAILAKLAVEAVRQWKYRPYLLNGQPVDMETQITINFQLPR